MTPVLITGPSVEPLSLDEARAWLKLDTQADDSIVGTLITAARLRVEQETRLILTAQHWRLVADGWPCRTDASRQGNAVRLPLAPVISVDAIRLLDAHDVATNLDPASWRLDNNRMRPQLKFLSAPPAPLRLMQGVEIDLTLGFGAAGTDVPEPLRQAMRLLLAQFYFNRGDDVQPVPQQALAFLAPYRRLRVTA